MKTYEVPVLTNFRCWLNRDLRVLARAARAAAAVGMTLHLNQRSRLEPRPIRFVAASRNVPF